MKLETIISLKNIPSFTMEKSLLVFLEENQHAELFLYQNDLYTLMAYSYDLGKTVYTSYDADTSILAKFSFSESNKRIIDYIDEFNDLAYVEGKTYYTKYPTSFLKEVA